MLKSGSFMVGDKKRKVSMKLIASLAPARAEVEAGVVAKADQLLWLLLFWNNLTVCHK